jgi:hypothetical protein
VPASFQGFQDNFGSFFPFASPKRFADFSCVLLTFSQSLSHTLGHIVRLYKKLAQSRQWLYLLAGRAALPV